MNKIITRIMTLFIFSSFVFGVERNLSSSLDEQLLKEINEVALNVDISKNKATKTKLLEQTAEKYIGINQYDLALKVYEKILEQKKISKRRKFECHSKIGDIYSFKKDYVNSIESYKEALFLHKKDVYIRIKIGEMFLKSKLYDLAENSFLEALAIDKNSSAAQKGLGDVFYDQKFYTKAISYYDKIEPGKYDRETVLKIAECYRNLNKSDDAVSIVETFMHTEYKDHELVFLLGLLYMDKNEYEQSEALFLNLINNGVRNFKVYVYLASIYDLSGDLVQAEKMLDVAYRINSSHAIVDYMLAEINYKMGRLYKAIMYAKNACAKAKTTFVKEQSQKLLKFLNNQ